MSSDEEVAAIVNELIAAADGLMEAMYNSDLEASWRSETERWHAAMEAARALPGVQAG